MANHTSAPHVSGLDCSVQDLTDSTRTYSITLTIGLMDGPTNGNNYYKGNRTDDEHTDSANIAWVVMTNDWS